MNVKISDKPVIVQRCSHGKVFKLTAALSNLDLSKVFEEADPADTVEIVSLADCPKLSSCDVCGFLIEKI